MSGGHGHQHVPSRQELAAMAQKPLPGSLRTISLVLAAVGFAIFIYGAATGQDRAWQAFQFNWMFFWTVSAAGVAFAAVQRITTARWSRSVVRMLEGMVAFLPVGVVLLLVTLLFGLDHIYPWATHAPEGHEKALWLAKGFLIPRDLLAAGLFAGLGLWFVYNSVRMDVAILPEAGLGWAKGLREKMRAGFGHERRELHTQHSLQGKIAVAMCIIFGFGTVVLAWDLSMSADVHFQSTMYGWQVMMGGWVAMLMLFALLVRWFRDQMGAGEIIGEQQFHDIGKLAFAFTAFWGYLTFSQYLVIWYGNWSEETHFFNLRLSGVWKGWTLSYVVLAFILPFFGLMGKYPKIWFPTMATFAVSGLLGIWIHRYIELYPSIYGETTTLPFGLFEIGCFLGYLGLWGWTYTSFMDAFPKIRVFMMTSEYRDEVQIPVNAETMEPLPAHE
ncbi:MAG: hypothetical protein HY275_19650 [Gemmatimonadetes bacterium]|nr:hypothetical protein [Gemmatimonadota bacterium]